MTTITNYNDLHSLQELNQEKEYDIWFNNQVQKAFDELDDPNFVGIEHEKVLEMTNSILQDKLAKKQHKK